ncbi:MAG TPA: permease-like cell division protein FtsX [Solirubrobacteraceae bacterium]|nr:permease-like cell division protein FtsX [Solirubrobacteraceae bacterium]
MQLGFFLREALRAMRRNAWPSAAALIAVLVTMLVLGAFIPAVQAGNYVANVVRGRLIVDVFMKTNATAADAARVRRELLAVHHVKSVTFVSKEQAYQQEVQADPQGGWQLIGTNPLPDTFHVYPDNPSNVLAVHAALTPGGGVLDPAIGSVSNKRQDTRKALELTSAVRYGGLAFAALLTLASVLLIANTIRLSLYARRREVEVMKLVGATDWFIRWPFVIEGVVVGATGGLLAIALLGIVKVTLLDPLFSGWALVSEIKTMAFPVLIAILVGASVAVSAVGSGLSLRRFLRV